MSRAVYVYQGAENSKFPLTIGEEEKLWLKRMIYGEASKGCTRHEAAALCWAITNRWFLWKGARWYRTFLKLMKAYSQPINHEWVPGGRLFRKSTPKSRVKRRRRVRAMTSFPNDIDLAVEDFAAGELGYPAGMKGNPRVTDWAASAYVSKKFPWGVDVRGNWFFEAHKNLRSGRVYASVLCDERTEEIAA